MDTVWLSTICSLVICWLTAEYDPPLMSACENALADDVYFPIAQLLR
jgi:hypothetical protein